MKERKYIRERFRNMFSKTPLPASVEDKVANDPDKNQLEIHSIYDLGSNLALATIDGVPCVIRGRWETPSCYIRRLRDLETVMYTSLMEKDPEGVRELKKTPKKKEVKK